MQDVLETPTWADFMAARRRFFATLALSEHDPPSAAVDVEAVIAEEGDQRHPEPFRSIGGEA